MEHVGSTWSASLHTPVNSSVRFQAFRFTLSKMSTLNDLDEITIDYDQRLEMQPIGENVQLGKQQQKQQQQVCHPKHTILIRGRGINL